MFFRNYCHHIGPRLVFTHSGGPSTAEGQTKNQSHCTFRWKPLLNGGDGHREASRAPVEDEAQGGRRLETERRQIPEAAAQRLWRGTRNALFDTLFECFNVFIMGLYQAGDGNCIHNNGLVQLSVRDFISTLNNNCVSKCFKTDDRIII